MIAPHWGSGDLIVLSGKEGKIDSAAISCRFIPYLGRMSSSVDWIQRVEACYKGGVTVAVREREALQDALSDIFSSQSFVVVCTAFVCIRPHKQRDVTGWSRAVGRFVCLCQNMAVQSGSEKRRSPKVLRISSFRAVLQMSGVCIVTQVCNARASQLFTECLTVLLCRVQLAIGGCQICDCRVARVTRSGLDDRTRNETPREGGQGYDIC